MGRALKPGEEVTWNANQGETHGHAIKRTMRRGKTKDHDVAASADNPECILENEKSGKRAAHKRSALKKT